MARNLETLKIAFEVDAKKIPSELKKVSAYFKNVKGVNVGVSADTAEAQKKLSTLQNAMDAMQGTTLGVSVDTGDGVRKIQQMEEASKGLMDVMKGIGAIAIGKKVFDFGKSLVTAAGDAEQIMSRAANTLGQQGFADLSDYAKNMEDLYGFNSTGLIASGTSFSGAFKEMGFDAQEAVGYGKRMLDLVIDYASYMDKGTGDVADVIMSLMKGNYEVADNLNMFTLSAESLDELAEDLVKRGLLDPDMSEKAMRNVALVYAMEQSQELQNIAGDWERTADQFANQKIIFNEQWTALQEDAGTLLLPAATRIVAGLNAIVGAVKNFAFPDTMENTFVADMKEYFGSLALDEKDIENMKQAITGPVADIVSAAKTSHQELLGAGTKLNSAWQSLAKLIYGTMTDELITDEDKKEMQSAVDDMILYAQGLLDTSKVDLITQLNLFTDAGMEEGYAAMLGIINSYFAQAQTELNAKKEEFQQALADWKETPTPENLEEIKTKAWEMNRASYESAAAEMSAREYVALQDMYKGGQLSAESIQAMIDAVTAAGAESRDSFNAALQAWRLDFLAMGQAVTNPETGGKYTLEELDAMWQSTSGQFGGEMMQDMENRMFDMVAKLIVGDYESAMGELFTKYSSGRLSPKETAEQGATLYQSLAPLTFFRPHGDAIDALSDQGQRLIALMDAAASIAQAYAMDPRKMDQYINDQFYSLPALQDYTFVGPMLPPDYAPNGSDASMTDTLTDISAALVNLPGQIRDNLQINATLQVGGYEFGKAVIAATEEVARSNGS